MIIVVLFKRIEIITSVGALAAYLGYAGIMLSTLITKNKLKATPGFSLGIWRKPVQIIALTWTLLVVAALSIPETDLPGITLKHLPAAMAVFVAALGTLMYFLYVRRKIIKGIAGPPAVPHHHQ